MAIFFTEEQLRATDQAYAAFPDPKPNQDDFYTYVFHRGIENVKAQDPALVRVAAKALVDQLWHSKYLGRRGPRPIGEQP